MLGILPLHHKQTFPPMIWIFTECDGIKSRLPFKYFSTLPCPLLTPSCNSRILWSISMYLRKKMWYFYHAHKYDCFCKWHDDFLFIRFFHIFFYFQSISVVCPYCSDTIPVYFSFCDISTQQHQFLCINFYYSGNGLWKTHCCLQANSL